ncbi:MAG: hypothetical protein LBD85_00085 [Oscillospiraceae bacterium]|jgi:hypothetical protein|nr:hypothetical protein [Oscillospiraceae bacterium]
MKVKNLTTKPIGFGTLVLLPDQTAELPADFGKDHPTTKYYISRKWLSVLSASASAKVNPTVAPKDTGKQGDDADEAASEKSLSKMLLDELKAVAVELGIVYDDNVTRKVLIEAINAAKETE